LTLPVRGTAMLDKMDDGKCCSERVLGEANDDQQSRAAG
jgi:hypothetical protein